MSTRAPEAKGIYKRGSIYWFEQQRNHKPVYVSLETTDFGEAVQKAKDLRDRPEMNEAACSKLRLNVTSITNSAIANSRVTPKRTQTEADRSQLGATDDLPGIKASHITFQGAQSGKAKQISKDISPSIKGGELVGIIGASGSGKSTLLQSMSGIRRASSGTDSDSTGNLCDLEWSPPS